MNRIALSGLLIFTFAFARAHASTVAVKNTSEGWKLLIDSQPFVIKGVGCNTAGGTNGENYLKLAQEMGANSVRTWGVMPRDYFDRAQSYGLKVDAGIWFNPVRSGMPDSYEDPAYRKRLKDDALAYVKSMKNHPALLIWNLGNEVFNFTESNLERKAFGLFLEDLIQAVHKEDPNHPVMYACAGGGDLPFLKAYVPSLDIVGVNTYGGYPYILRWVKANNYDRPVIATEFGPYGAWDRMKDVNHYPYDSDDKNKAKNYEDIWDLITKTKDQSLGGYAFVIGDQRNQDSLTWYNINYGMDRREAYWTLYRCYTGKEPANRSPRIRLLQVEKVTGLKPGEAVPVSVNAMDPDGDPLTYEYFVTDIANDPLIVQPPRYYPCDPQAKSAGHAVIHAPNEPGMYRVYAAVRDGKGNIAISNRSIQVK